jgi:hypothetical protein
MILVAGANNNTTSFREYYFHLILIVNIFHCMLSHIYISALKSLGLEFAFRGLLVPLLSGSVPCYHFPLALACRVHPLPLRPDAAFDVLIGNPAIVPIIGDEGCLEDPPGLLMHQN